MDKLTKRGSRLNQRLDYRFLAYVLGLIIWVFLGIASGLIDNTNYLVVYNLGITILVSLIIFHYKVEVQNIYNERREKLRVYGEAYVLLEAAFSNSKNMHKEEPFVFSMGQLKGLRDLFNRNRHIFSESILNLWEEAANDQINGKYIMMDELGGTRHTDTLWPIKMDDKIISEIRREVSDLKKMGGG